METNNKRNSTYIILGVGLLFVLLIVLQTSQSSDSPYIIGLKSERANKDVEFKEAQDSPIPEADRATFEGLAYFKPNLNYISKAKFVQATGTDTLTLMTSNGKEKQMIHAGQFTFEMQGLNHRLIAYRYLDPTVKELFIPFRDLTSGAETYGGGRYLDLEVDPNSLADIKIDFNKAYQPYCVYNKDFICPIPPPENKMLIEVRAGEKMKEKAKK